MAKPRQLSLDMAWRIGLALESAEKGTTYNSPALKVRGRVFACVPTHRSAEPGSLVVRTTWDTRDRLLAEAPEVYYLPDHYRNYPFVLVRLRAISRDALKDLLGAAWQLARGKSG